MNKNIEKNIIRFFGQEKNILAFVTTKELGNFRGDILAVKKLIKNLGFSNCKVAMGDLNHGRKVFEVKGDNFSPTKLIEKTDGIFTREGNIFLAVTFADCLPVFFYHPQERIIGLLHVGWRGASRGIIENFLKNFKKEKRNDWKVTFGPNISWKNYEFDLKTAQENFADFPGRIRKSTQDNKCYLDVKGIVKDKLVKNGVLEDNIVDSRINTFSDERFFSFRKDASGREGLKACVAVIGIVN